MVDVQTETVICVPVAQVAAYAADPMKAPEWYVNIRSADWQTTGGLAIGSRIAFRARFLGRDLAYVYEVTEYEPEHKLVMRTADGPFPMETTYTWASQPNGNTRMTLRNRGIPRGFSRIFAPFMSRAMRKANKKDLQRLKYLLER